MSASLRSMARYGSMSDGSMSDRASRAGVAAATAHHFGATSRRHSWALATMLIVGAVLHACGNGDDTVPTTPTTTTSTTASPTTIVAADGLDCRNEQRMTTIMEPPEGFAGYPTPQEAAQAAANASMIPLAGPPENVGGNDWIVRATDGRAVARTQVGPWDQGWFAGEITACDDGQHGA